MNKGESQGGGVNISGAVDTVHGDIVGRDKIINIIQLVTSPIGQAIEAESPPGPNIYVDKKHQFSISWPKDSDWIPSSRMGAYQLSKLGVTTSHKASFLFGLLKKEILAMFGVFKVRPPNNTCVAWVKISIYPKILDGQHMVKFLAAMCIKAARETGCEVVSHNIDVDTAEVVIAAGTSGPEIVQTVILGKDYVYLVVSPRYPLKTFYHDDETQVVLNSFRLLN